MNPEAELSRGASVTRSLRKEERVALDQQPLSLLLDSQVLTFREWCRLNRISARTGRRVLASGTIAGTWVSVLRAHSPT